MADDVKNLLSLRVRGLEHRGWTSASVTRSIENAASTFALELTESWPGQQDPIGIRADDPCELRMGDDLVIKGYMDVLDIDHDSKSHTIQATGRSKTMDLVDCSCLTGKGEQFIGLSLLQIARQLAEPYNVEVVLSAESGDVWAALSTAEFVPITRWAPEEGEHVVDALLKLASDQQLLVTDDTQGRLVLGRPGTKQGPSFSCPGNILKGHLRCDASQRYSWYCVKGQRQGDDTNFGAVVAQSIAIIGDEDIIRRRVLVIPAERQMTDASAKKRATWEAVYRAGRSATYECTVKDWRDETGALYEPGTLCAIEDVICGVDAKLLLTAATWTLDASGMTTALSFAPPGAYEPEPPIEQAKKKGGKAKASKITTGIAPWGWFTQARLLVPRLP